MTLALLHWMFSFCLVWCGSVVPLLLLAILPLLLVRVVVDVIGLLEGAIDDDDFVDRIDASCGLGALFVVGLDGEEG